MDTLLTTLPLLLTTLQTVLCGGMAAALVIGIPAAMSFGCPPAGVPFKGYYRR